MKFPCTNTNFADNPDAGSAFLKQTDLETQRTHLMEHHVFVSYVREDYEAVEKLCNLLRESDIRTWIDRNDIPPGARWKREIRNAISEGDFFLACFSPNYVNRTKTYMNEELTLAVELLRQMPAARAWFIPVLLEECELPDREIGGGETLLDLQQVRLYEDWAHGIEQIVSVVSPHIAKEDPERHAKKTRDRTRILFLAANPFDTTRLRVDEELRAIQSSLIEGEVRDRFQVETRWAVTITDLRRAFLEIDPQIIHFAGHGTRSMELVFEDENGKAIRIGANTLRLLFDLLSHKVECLILNCSNSLELAKTIAPKANYIIAMSDNIGDKEAIVFSSAFYQALAYGRKTEESFELARMGLALTGVGAEHVPVLIKNRVEIKS